MLFMSVKALCILNQFLPSSFFSGFEDPCCQSRSCQTRAGKAFSSPSSISQVVAPGSQRVFAHLKWVVFYSAPCPGSPPVFFFEVPFFISSPPCCSKNGLLEKCRLLPSYRIFSNPMPDCGI